MTSNGADALIRTLVGAGVDTCFANPGTSEIHLVAALDAVPELRAILTLFEGEHFHVTVVLWPEARSATLSPRDCEYIRKRFAGPRPRDWLLHRKTEAPDDVLLGGVEEIEKALQRTANRGLVDYFTVPILVLSFLGVWVLLLLVRARVRSGAEPDASAQRPALLGALFGTVPAFWVHSM